MKIPVLYTPKMCADSRSFSRSASKPGLVVDAWLRAGFDLDIVPVIGVGEGSVELAHEAWYVKGVLDGSISNGFGNTSLEIAATLPYTVGSMVDAAMLAIGNGRGAVSPTSGFHHAASTHAGGFCTFNGLMVAAMMLSDKKVGILDLDMHFGNGTANIISRLNAVHVKHYSEGGSKRSHMPGTGGAWLAKMLPFIVERFVDCDVVLYQAGADPHVDDPLGGWLSTEELLERDRIVFSTLREWGVPVAWNLAGGYQDPFSKVIDIHVNTMRAFAESFNKEI